LPKAGRCRRPRLAAARPERPHPRAEIDTSTRVAQVVKRD
jgi:hypothetical protein